MTDLNLPRWLVASVRKHFDDRKNGVYLHFEGTGFRNQVNPDGTPIVKWAELRIDGPYEKVYTRADFAYVLEINILLGAGIDDVDTNGIDDLLGIFGTAFTNCISVFKFGNRPSDDQSQIGILQLIPSKTAEVQLTRFGQIGPDTRFTQAAIEGHYKMNLTS